MPQHWRDRTVYVVPEAELEAYSSWVETARNMSGVTVVGCPERGIARTRHWIGELAAERGESKFAMMDDDLSEIHVRVAPDDWHLRPASEEEFDRMMKTVEYLLDEYAHVGVSPREGNNRFGVGPEPLVHECTRTLRFLCYRTADFLSVEHGRVEVMEDFDVNLQLLRSGRKNCDVKYWAQNQRGTGARGGCSTYRTHALHDACARRLAELHAPYVRLREKRNRSGGEFGHRTEVTIQWRRAYQDSVARPAEAAE